MADTRRAANPFPGLRPFRSDEDYLFFGREEQTAELLTLLRKHRFLAIVGTSGSGKSSLVRAGLLPELEGGTINAAGSAWEVAVMRPGGDPLTNLARGICAAGLYDAEDRESLPRLLATLRHSGMGLLEAFRQSEIEPGANLLVVVDQFEELFRFQRHDAASRDAARAFVNVLLEASRQTDHPVYIVLTMRSDYLGDCSQFRGLAEAVNDGEYLIPRLNREQLRSAIEGPVKVGGARIAHRLVQLLLNDVGDDPDQLPILQHALMRTWDHWVREGLDGEPIDLSHYEGIGGMREALSRHADEVLEGLADDRHRVLAERVFKALTEKGVDNRGIRRPTRLGKLAHIASAEIDDVATVIDAYRRPGVTFLMPGMGRELSAETVIDLSHESLMRVWRRLSVWVDEESESARIYRRLLETARLWGGGRAGLYRDPDLQIARSWREESDPNEAWAEQYGGGFAEAMAFLDTSRNAAEEADREREAARERELEQAKALVQTRERAARNFKRFAVGMSVLAVLAVMLSVWAMTLKERAEDSESRADAEARAARSARAEAEKLLTLARHEQGRTWLERARYLLREKRHLGAKLMAGMAVGFEGYGRASRDSVFRENHPVLLERGSREWREVDRMIRLEPEYPVIWKSPTRRHHDHHLGVSTGLEFSPDGAILASSREAVRLWDVETGEEVATLRLPEGAGVVTVSFSPDGTLLATGGGGADASPLRLWDVASGQEIATLEGHTSFVRGVDFSPDGALLVSSGVGGSVVLWSVAERREVAVLEGHTGTVKEVVFSPDGSLVASVGLDEVVRLWDVSTRAQVAELTAGTILNFVACSPDGSLVAAAGEDGGAYVWEIASRNRVARLEHPRRLSVVRFSHGGDVLVTAMSGPQGEAVAGGAVRFWSVASWKELVEFAEGAFEGLCVSPDGALLATGDSSGTIRLWKLPSAGDEPGRAPEEVAPARGGHSHAVQKVSFSPDGTLLASSDAGGVVILWDAATGAPVARWAAATTGDVLGLAFSPDGSELAACVVDTRSFTGTLMFWDVAAREEIAAIKTQSVVTVAYGPDGRSIITSGGAGGSAGAVHLWDAASRRRVAEIPFTTGGIIVSLALSPDGVTLAAGGTDGSVRLVDLARREEIAVFAGHAGIVWGLAFSPDGTVLASSAGDGTVRLWDTAEHESMTTLEGHRGSFGSVAFRPSGSILASGGDDGSVRLWDTSTRRPVAVLEGHGAIVHGVAFSPDGATLAATYRDGSVRLAEVPVPLVTTVDLGGPVDQVAFRPDGQSVAASTADGKLHLVDVVSGIETALFDGHTTIVEDLSFSPGGTVLASAGRDRTVKLWDLETGELRATLGGFTDWATSVSFSPDGARLVSGSDDRSIHLWDVASGTLIGTMSGHEDYVRAAVFSPDGTMVASGGFDRTVRLWNADTGREIARLEGHKSAVKCVSFHPDGVLVASCDDAATIRLWDVTERREVAVLSAPGPLNQVLFTPDGEHLVSCGDTIRLWDVASRSELGTLEGHGSRVRSVDTSPDGKTLVSASGDGSLRFWSLRHPRRARSDYASYLDGYEIAGRDITPKRRANLYRSDARALAPLMTDSHIAILRREAPPAEVDRALFRAYFRAKNWESAALVLGRLERMLAREDAEKERQLFVDTLLRDTEGVIEKDLSDLAERRLDLAEKVGGAQARIWGLRADVLDRLDKPDEARTAFQRGIDLARSRGAAGERSLSRIVWERFRFHIDRNDLEGARDDLEILWSEAAPPRGVTRDRLFEDYAHAWVDKAVPTVEGERLDAVREPVLLAALAEAHLQATRATPMDPEALSFLEPLVAEERKHQPDLELVSRDSEWRYLDDGTDPGAGWREVEFEDGSWAPGRAPLGFGDDREATRLRRNADDVRAGDTYPSFYFRCRFHVGELTKGRWLALRVARDDGVVVYLNGVEILRDNMPAGPVAHHTLATSTVGGEDEARVREFRVDASLLREDVNVLAAEVHQATLDSSDLYFEASLTATFVTVASYLRGLDRGTLDRLFEAASSFLPPSLAREWLGAMRVAWSAPGDEVLEAEKDPEVWRVRRRIQDMLWNGPAALEAAERETALREAKGWPGGDEKVLELAEALRLLGRPARAEAVLGSRLAPVETLNVDLLALLGDVSLGDLDRSPEEFAGLLPSHREIPWDVLGSHAASAYLELERTRAIRINCGGDAYTTPAGVRWGRDRFFNGGAAYTGGLGAFAGGIARTDHDPLYQTERYLNTGIGLRSPSLYAVPLPLGRYRVVLHFAEIWGPFREPGERVFDVEIEGVPVIKGYDLAATVGFATADTKEFTVEVTDGILDIGCTKLNTGGANPKFSAIEIVPAE